MNTKTKSITKKQMVETIQQAVAKMEKPWDVRLTTKCIRDLTKPNNRVYLEGAYTWAVYILTWQYPTLPSDNINDDYKELMHVIETMYIDNMLISGAPAA